MIIDQRRTEGPEFVFPTSKPVAPFWSLIDKEEPKCQLCARSIQPVTYARQIKRIPSKCDILLQTRSVSREREPKQHDGLFERPRDAEDEEEGKKRVLMTLRPEIRRLWEHCTSFFIRQFVRAVISVPSFSEMTTTPAPMSFFYYRKLAWANLL